jgi:glycosyltransferase involved in cell wall biosynthesis
MKISVVVPTYKRPNLLLRCVEALRSQEFQKSEYEIIVVSDGPDSETQSALEELKKDGPLIRFLSLPAKRGPAAARNFGWRSSRCDLIVFTDDDCIPDQQWLANFWSTFLNVKTFKAAFKGNTIVPIPPVPTDYERNISNLATAEFITANCACTRSALESVGGFDEEFTMAWREDSDLQFKFIEHQIPIISVDALVTHPVRKAPWGVCLKDEKKGIFNSLLYKKYPELYKQRIQASPPWHYYTMVTLIIAFVIGLLTSSTNLASTSFVLWFILVLWFTAKRLRNTKRDLSHIIEMLFTSMFIPFLSIYYRICGAIKFRSQLLP